jgi:hypothetical protein
MALADIVEAAKRNRGIKCYKLEAIRDAYLEAHPELHRKRGSKFLYRDIRRELDSLGARMWPETLPSNEQELLVYVIVRSSKIGHVLRTLNAPPNETAAAALCDYLDVPTATYPKSD